MFVAREQGELAPPALKARAMTDIALTNDTILTDRAESTRRASRGDARFHFFTWAAAALVLAIFIGVIISLVSISVAFVARTLGVRLTGDAT